MSDMVSLQSPLRKVIIKTGEKVTAGSIYIYTKYITLLAHNNPETFRKVVITAHGFRESEFDDCEQKVLGKKNLLTLVTPTTVIFNPEAIQIIKAATVIDPQGRIAINSPVPREEAQAYAEAQKGFEIGHKESAPLQQPGWITFSKEEADQLA